MVTLLLPSARGGPLPLLIAGDGTHTLALFLVVPPLSVLIACGGPPPLRCVLRTCSCQSSGWAVFSSVHEFLRVGTGMPHVLLVRSTYDGRRGGGSSVDFHDSIRSTVLAENDPR